ncbi:hypothetical protein [Streptomyces sp. NPDC092129]|uniref:hypothetical protein n=1 Tax=Streptomyces sp. NPDC092129 TaxID=3366010 RepID=UPI0038128881
MPAVLRFIGEAKDMTLEELAAFVEAARKADVPRDNPVRAELSMSGKIKQVEVRIGVDDD